jgi:hypothetical protein
VDEKHGHADAPNALHVEVLATPMKVEPNMAANHQQNCDRTQHVKVGTVHA